MNWENRRQSRRLVDELLRTAETCPNGVPALADLSHADLPVGPDGRWLALQDRWLSLLTGHLGATLRATDGQPDGDRLDAVMAAWRDLAERQPTLRRLLDSSTVDTPAVRAAAHREARLLAMSAGLAAVGERPEQVAEVGSVFRCLLRQPAVRSTARIPLAWQQMRDDLATSV